MSDAQSLADSAYGELLDIFSNPPRDFSPTPLWWWSGGKVTTERIRYQLEQLHAGGVFNVVVINLAPSGPMYTSPVDDPQWFSEEWWARFEDACEIAGELGMRIWFYDQVGFSGANVQGRIRLRHPQAAGKKLLLEDIVVGTASASAVTQNLVAAYDESRRRVALDGGLESLVVGSRLTLVRLQETAYDYLDRHACALLIDEIHGEFERRLGKYLGNVIAGSFQDELPNTNGWTDGFPEAFLAAHGYDICDHLPALFEPRSDADHRVLRDYQATRAALTEAALFEPLGAWHRDRNMLIGADQGQPARAGAPTQATQMYADYMRTHRHYSAAGNDHEGDSKFHSSLRHLYGGERTWLESFWGSGWGTTPADLYDWLLPYMRAGATLYNPHAVYFDLNCGWFEWAPPSTDWRQPYWEQYPAFATCIARIMSMMSWGSHRCHVAVLHPTSTVAAHTPLTTPVDHFGTGQIGIAEVDQAQAVYNELVGSNDWWRGWIGALNEAAVDFDIIDDASIESSTANAGALEVRDERYRMVLLPATNLLNDGTVAGLLRLVRAGGQVVAVGTAPAHTGSGELAELQLLLEHKGFSLLPDAAATARSVASMRALDCDLPSLVRHRGDMQCALVPAANPSASPVQKTRFAPVMPVDAGNYAESAAVRLPAGTTWAEAWNPATGDRHALELVESDGQVDCLLQFAGAPALLLLSGSQAPTRALEPVDGPAVSREILLTDWRGTAVAKAPNRFHELSASEAEMLPLQIWNVDVADVQPGDVPNQWLATSATFGPKGKLIRHGNVQTWSYSDSRGLEHDPCGLEALGPKGNVPLAFIRVEDYDGSETVAYETLVHDLNSGSVELLIGSPAAKRVIWNGKCVYDGFGGEGEAHDVRVEVTATSGAQALRLEFSVVRAAEARTNPGAPPPLIAYFGFAEPNTVTPRAEFIRALGAEPGPLVLSHDFVVADDVTAVRGSFGAAPAIEIRIDGKLVATHAPVEYYGSDWGAPPVLFNHDLTSWCDPGAHHIEIVCADATETDLFFADIVFEGPHPSVLTSDRSWNAHRGDVAVEVALSRYRWTRHDTSEIAVRAHPLPSAMWLRGPVAVGNPHLAVSCAADDEGQDTWLRVVLPAGTNEVVLPILRSVDAAWIDDVEVPWQLHDGNLRIAVNQQHTSTLTIRCTASVVNRGGAALAGPVALELGSAPIALIPWSEQGLGWHSGALRYATTVTVQGTQARALLDLGQLHGTARVFVNEQHAGDLFCSPWALDVAALLVNGDNAIVVEVSNTLSPYLSNTSPTGFAYATQQVDGMFGPVCLRISG